MAELYERERIEKNIIVRREREKKKENGGLDSQFYLLSKMYTANYYVALEACVESRVRYIMRKRHNFAQAKLNLCNI